MKPVIADTPAVPVASPVVRVIGREAIAQVRRVFVRGIDLGRARREVGRFFVGRFARRFDERARVLRVGHAPADRPRGVAPEERRRAIGGLTGRDQRRGAIGEERALRGGEAIGLRPHVDDDRGRALVLSRPRERLGLGDARFEVRIRPRPGLVRLGCEPRPGGHHLGDRWSVARHLLARVAAPLSIGRRARGEHGDGEERER
jgi:hypothetical protein